jgi:hypothetical protein
MNRVKDNGYHFDLFLLQINEWLGDDPEYRSHRSSNTCYKLKVIQVDGYYTLIKEYKDRQEPFELGMEKTKEEMAEYIDGLYRGFQMFA